MKRNSILDRYFGEPKQYSDLYYLERNLLGCPYERAIPIIKALFNSYSEATGIGHNKGMQQILATKELGCAYNRGDYSWSFEDGECTNVLVIARYESIIGMVRQEMERGLKFINSISLKNTVYWYNPKLDIQYFIRTNHGLAIVEKAGLHSVKCKGFSDTQITEELQYLITQSIRKFEYTFKPPDPLRIIGDEFPFEYYS